MLLHLLPKTVRLRSGYTTGACATAAAKGAAQMLVLQESVSEVTVGLPGGVSATFQLHGQNFTTDTASCFVIKDAGDDPDVTNGAELHAEVRLAKAENEQALRIVGGVGIGKVTKPGLAVSPGDWAINPVPRRMVIEAVQEAFSLYPSSLNVYVELSIPDGEERAKKTLNARLGIIGGLSILGTTGIVRPISAKAWTDTIDASLDVAKACGCENVVLSTGRTSELAAQKLFKVQSSKFNIEPGTLNAEPLTTNHEPLPEEAYVMMGDHVAYALQACAKRGFMRPIIACQFAKLLKIACGYPDTHAAASELDLATLARWAEEAGISTEIVKIISQANTAREVAIVSGFDSELVKLVSERVKLAAARHAPDIAVHPLLCDYDCNVVGFVASAC